MTSPVYSDRVDTAIPSNTNSLTSKYRCKSSKFYHSNAYPKCIIQWIRSNISNKCVNIAERSEWNMSWSSCRQATRGVDVQAGTTLSRHYMTWYHQQKYDDTVTIPRHFINERTTHFRKTWTKLHLNLTCFQLPVHNPYFLRQTLSQLFHQPSSIIICRATLECTKIMYVSCIRMCFLL